VKIFVMLAHFHSNPRPNPVVAGALDMLRRRGLQVDVGFADRSLLRVDGLRVTHDLYVLKSHSDYWLSVADILHGLGAPLVNPYPACRLTRDKFAVTRQLGAAGVPVPPTWLTGDLDLLREIVAECPLIIKPNSGRPVAPIVVARSAADLSRLHPLTELMLAQEYVEGSGADLKVYVIGGQVFAVRRAYRRGGPKELGELTPVSEGVRDIALRCGAACGLSLYGLDVIEGRAGPVVVDVNYFPSFLGVPDAASLVADHIAACLEQTPDGVLTARTSASPANWPRYRYDGAWNTTRLEVPTMSRAASEGPAVPHGQPTMTEIEVYRFCRSLLEWEGVHLVGQERVGSNVRVLLSTDEGTQEWCDSMAACETFRSLHGEPT
jgi:glutathione synthase/RimK-type ligase-like ATP-grasp enzyme